MPSRKMRTAIYFFMGWMLRFGRNGPSRAPHPTTRAVYPPEVGQCLEIVENEVSTAAQARAQARTQAWAQARAQAQAQAQAGPKPGPSWGPKKSKK